MSTLTDKLAATAGDTDRIARKYHLSSRAITSIEDEAKRLGLSYSRTLELIVMDYMGRDIPDDAPEPPPPTPPSAPADYTEGGWDE